MEHLTKLRLNWCVKWGLISVLALIFAFQMTGCNTVKGLSQDLYSVAEGIQNEMGTTHEQ